jgi:pyruvate/2-oxoglutarate dehydrogenase complex dihydrolipoamide acyltransferase (E2) component
MVISHGMTMTEATLVAWLIEVGETVQKGDPVAAIMTDKVEMEVEAPASGQLSEQLVAVDEDFSVPGAIGRIRAL